MNFSQLFPVRISTCVCIISTRTKTHYNPLETLDILFQAKSKFGLNIIDVSTKFTQCQVILRNKLLLEILSKITGPDDRPDMLVIYIL